MGKLRRTSRHWPKLRAVLVVALSCALLFSVLQLRSIWLLYNMAQKEYTQIAKIAHSSMVRGGQAGAPNGNINFLALTAINPDVVAWINLPKTSLDYPIVRSDDNEKYLQTTFNGQTSPSGSIFMDCATPQDLSCKNTIIYGHNMSDGSMFGILNNFKDQDFFEKNSIIYLTIDRARFVCKIFSAYRTPSNSESYTPSFSDDFQFGKFLRDITALSLIDADISVQPQDSIITLSSCSGWGILPRMVVHAKLSPAL